MGYASHHTEVTQRQCQVKTSLWASGIWYLSHEDFTGDKDAGGRKKMAHPAWSSGLMMGALRALQWVLQEVASA